MPRDDDPYRRRPSDSNLPAAPDNGVLYGLMQNMRADFQEAIAGIDRKVDGLREQIGCVQAEMGERDKTQAILRHEVNELISGAADTDMQVRELQNESKVRRALSRREDDEKQPKQYGIVATTIISTIIALVTTSVVGWFLVSWAKSVVASGGPTP